MLAAMLRPASKSGSSVRQNRGSCASATNLSMSVNPAYPPNVLKSVVVLRRPNPEHIADFREFPYKVGLFCLLGDAAIVFSALCLAFWLRFDSPLRHFGVDPSGLSLGDYWNYIVCGSLSLLLVLAQKRMYEAAWLLHQQSVLRSLVAACLLWGIGFLGVSLLFEFKPSLSRVYVGIATITEFVGLYLWRLLLNQALRRKGVVEKLRQRILVIGWSQYTKKLVKAVAKDLFHPYEIVACMPAPDGRFQEEPPESVRRAASYNDLPELLETLPLDIVLVADGNFPVKELEKVGALCEKELVQFKVVPSYFSVLLSGLYLETISGIPILGLSRLPLDRLFNRLLKRLIDIIGALFGLLLSIPLIAACGLLVYLESPGPILYRQRRLGRHGKTFEMLKIRSMRLDAEKDGRAGWSVKDDPRRLRIGGFIRRWNIDETPQFWNVLKGDMSLVGPRPERPELIQDFKTKIPHYNARHTVKPGITGWAQVHGYRGDTDLIARVTYDLYYVEHWNVFFDFLTMLLTFFRYGNAG